MYFFLDSSSDDDSALNEGSTPEQEHLPHSLHQATTSQSDTSSTSSTRETPSPQWYNGRPNRLDDYWIQHSPVTNLVMQNLTPSMIALNISISFMLIYIIYIYYVLYLIYS